MTTEEHNEIVNTIIERPTSLSIGGRFFLIEPLTLGKTLILQRYASLLVIDRSHLTINPLLTLLEICEKNEDIVCHMIAIYLTNKREDILDDNYINRMSNFISRNLNVSDRATILKMYFDLKPISHYMKILTIDKEKERLHKIQKAKGEDSGSIQVGGVSMFGSLIDAACERYKWSYQYVLWGISYNALQLMMADMVQSIYLTEKERAKAKISTDGINLSGDSQENINIIKNLIRN